MEEKKPSLLVRLKRKLAYAIVGSHFWSNILEKYIPYIRFTTYYPRFPRFKFQIFYSEVQVGDILLTVDYRKLTSILIPGDWSHAAIVVGKGKGLIEVVEMTHKGFYETDLHKVCSESERVRIKRVVDPRWGVDKFITNVWKHKGSKYNYAFLAKEKLDPRNKNGDKIHPTNYCSQLVTQADEDNILDVNWDDLMGLGVPYISPDGLDKGKNLITVYDTGEIEE
jgi:hypothetical protein